MKIVVAVDSFKGSLSSLEAGSAISEGIHRVMDDAKVFVRPLADDRQTVMGKAPIGVAGIAKKYQKPVIAFSGCVTEDATACNQHGIDAFFPILRTVTTLDDAMCPETARKNMVAAVEQVFRLIKTLGRHKERQAVSL